MQLLGAQFRVTRFGTLSYRNRTHSSFKIAEGFSGTFQECSVLDSCLDAGVVSMPITSEASRFSGVIIVR